MLVVATVMVVIGVVAVVGGERTSSSTRSITSPLRNYIELILPAAGVLLLVWAVWRIV